MAFWASSLSGAWRPLGGGVLCVTDISFDIPKIRPRVCFQLKESAPRDPQGSQEALCSTGLSVLLLTAGSYAGPQQKRGGKSHR